MAASSPPPSPGGSSSPPEPTRAPPSPPDVRSRKTTAPPGGVYPEPRSTSACSPSLEGKITRGPAPAGLRRTRCAGSRAGARRPRGDDREETPHAGLAGTGVSPRGHLRRRGDELRRVLRGGGARRAVPAARRRLGDRGGAARIGRVRAARLPARGDAGTALRLPGARPVRAGARCAVQQRETAAGPVREGGQRPGRLGRVGLRLPLRLTRSAQRPGLGAAHHDLRGDQPLLRLGRRPAAAHRVPRDGALRGTREGPDDAPPGAARTTCAAPTRHWRTRRSSTT